MTTKRDGERTTVKLKPLEVAALLHEQRVEAEDHAAPTIEIVPLTDAIPDEDGEPDPEPQPHARLARGSNSAPRTTSTTSTTAATPTTRLKARRTRTKLRVDLITAPLRKKP